MKITALSVTERYRGACYQFFCYRRSWLMLPCMLDAIVL